LIIKEHETGGHRDSNLIREADALAFFNFDIHQYIKENTNKRTKEKIRFTYNRLSTKSKKNILKIKYPNKIKKIIFQTIRE